MIASLTAAALVAALTLPVGGPVPTYPTEDPTVPRVGAAAWIVYDATADVVLASWNADERRPMASVTKVMTAMVVLDRMRLDELVTVPASATRARGSTAGLRAGEELSVHDLLVAMLVRSGNDAALTLAAAAGGGSVDAFVAAMNRKARALGMDDTHFANPNGLDAEGHYSTARDLLTLISASREYPDIARIASIKLVRTAGADGEPRRFRNTNRLLGAYPGVVGLKTGDTPRADKVLLAVAERGPRTLYSVVLGSRDHFADTRELLEWGFSTYGLRDRILRPYYAEQGGGAVAEPTPGLTEGHERRLYAMPRLDPGRWAVSSLVDLPRARILGTWLREALPRVLEGDR
ncbi:MAG TPA: D-alanyl-D-alanine carboxypeptidase [Actinobacteria bacterium]|nr:D-alanyl-D-alanine carboxypeptidase [Actinomycetota bacterium]